MDERAIELRNQTYAAFVELGRAPSAREVAARSGASPTDVETGWRELHESHALVLHPDAAEIRMANPFSAVPSAYRVHARDRWWYANCAWDAIGVCAALASDGRIEASCPDCNRTLALDVRGERPTDESLLFHCLVPAARWWDDIGFT